MSGTATKTLFTSVLRETIENLPDDYIIKAESLNNDLMKKGVKAEELEQARLYVQPDESGRITKEALRKAETERADSMGSAVFSNDPARNAGETVYGDTVPTYISEDWEAMETYTEQVLTFKNSYADSANARWVHNHWPEIRDYNSHYRFADQQVALDNGVYGKRRNLFEIQSDLHQQAKFLGYQQAELDVDFKAVDSLLLTLEAPQWKVRPTSKGVGLTVVTENGANATLQLSDEALAKYQARPDLISRQSAYGEAQFGDNANDLSEVVVDNPSAFKSEEDLQKAKILLLQSVKGTNKANTIIDEALNEEIPAYGRWVITEANLPHGYTMTKSELGNGVLVYGPEGDSYLVTKAKDGSLKVNNGLDWVHSTNKELAEVFQTVKQYNMVNKDDLNRTIVYSGPAPVAAKAAGQVRVKDVGTKFAYNVRNLGTSYADRNGSIALTLDNKGELVNTEVINGQVDLDAPEIQELINLLVIKQKQRNAVADVADAPWKGNNWLRKTVEHAITRAQAEGIDEVYVPIKGPQLQQLERSDGVQDWYETQVLQTLTGKKGILGLKGTIVGDAKNLDPHIVLNDTTARAKEELITKYKIDPDMPFAIADKIIDKLQIVDVGPSSATRAALASDVISTYIMRGGNTTPEEVMASVLDTLKATAPSVPPGSHSSKYPTINEWKHHTKNSMDILYLLAKDGDVPEEVEEEFLRLSAYDSARATDMWISGGRGADVTTHVSELQKTLKNGDNELGVVIKIPKDPSKLKQATMYTNGATVAASAYFALKQGATPEQVSDYMTQNGISLAEQEAALAAAADMMANEADPDVIPADDEILAQAETAYGIVTEERDSNVYKNKWLAGPGMSLQQIEEHVGRKRSTAYSNLLNGEVKDAKDLVLDMQVVYPDLTTPRDLAKLAWGDQETADRMAAMQGAIHQKIIDKANSMGYPLVEQNGEYFLMTEQGPIRATPDMMETMGRDLGIIAGSVMAGIAGAKATPFPHPAAKFIGGMTAAAVADVALSEVQYLSRAIAMQESINGATMFQKAANTAEWSVIGEVLGLGVMKLGKGTWDSLINAKDFISKQNPQAAEKELKAALYLTDDEAADLVVKLQKAANVNEDFRDQTIRAAVLNAEGGLDILAAIHKTAPNASRQVMRDLQQRTASVRNRISSQAGEGVGKQVVDDFDNYKQLVKDQYELVKQNARTAPRAKQYKFNLEELAIMPVLQKLGNEIYDPVLLTNYGQRMAIINAASTGRSMADLIDLRAAVNEFRFDNRIIKHGHSKALTHAINMIDKELARAAEMTMDAPADWIREFAESRAAYGEMKKLETNTLAKYLSDAVAGKGKDKSIGEPKIVSRLVSSIESVDGTYANVMNKLPAVTRHRVEVSVMDQLLSKYSTDNAIDFPALSKALNKIELTSPEAKAMKFAIQELSDAFPRDVQIANILSGVSIEAAPKYLAQGMPHEVAVQRGRIETANNFLDNIRPFFPTQRGKATALVKNAARVLKNPMDQKSFDELVKEGLDARTLDSFRRLRELEADARSKGININVKLYGDKVLGTDVKGTLHRVPMSNIATQDVVAEVAELNNIRLEDTKQLNEALKQLGYKYRQSGTDKVKAL